MNLMNIIIICLAAFFLFSLLFYIIYGRFTEYKFDLIYDKFKKRFGYTPSSITIGRNGGFFFWGYKESYLISALIFPKLPATKKRLQMRRYYFLKN